MLMIRVQMRGTDRNPDAGAGVADTESGRHMRSAVHAWTSNEKERPDASRWPPLAVSLPRSHPDSAKAHETRVSTEPPKPRGLALAYV